MGTSLSVVGRILRAPSSLGALHLSSGNIEAVKWAGALLMVLDHVNTYLLGGGVSLLYVLGRLVFPMFALALGAALAERDEDAMRRALKRTVSWACIAQPATMLVREHALLNVLFLLAGGLLLVGLIERRSRKLIAVAPLALLASTWAEFGPAGLLMVVGVVWWSRHRRPVAAIGAVGGVAMLQTVNGTHAALLAFPALWAIVRCDFVVPRVRNAFQWVYVAQWPLLALARVAS